MRSKWLINDGITMELMSAHIDYILQSVKGFKPLEIDFSKFDKS